MKLLIFSPYYKPGFKGGGPIKSISSIVEALGEDYDFHIVTRSRDRGEYERYPGLQTESWVRSGEANVWYSEKNNLSFIKIITLIKSINPDVVYVNSLWDIGFSFKIIILFYLGFLGSSKVLMAPRGELSEGALGIKPRRKELFLKIFRKLGLYKNVLFHATSNYEKEEIELNLGIRQSNIFIAKNIPKIPSRMSEGYCFDTTTLKLIFISRISPKKNLKFALETLSRLEISVEFDIYGPLEDNQYWGECSEIISELPKNVVVNYKGSVSPDQVMDVLMLYDGMLFPTLGENYGHVIAESLLAGTKVIISDKTPWKKLNDSDLGYDLELKIEKFESAILDIYENLKYELPHSRAERMEVAKKLVGLEESCLNTRLMFNYIGKT